MTPPPLCKHCGGGLPQHQEGPCWCATCMALPKAQRCTDYEPRAPKGPGADAEGFGKKPPRPPKKAPKSAPGSDGGTPRAASDARPEARTPQGQVLEAIESHGDRGATDGEVAERLGWQRGEVVELRAELVSAELVWDSGTRRRDTRGHENVVWSGRAPDPAPPQDATPRLVRDDVYVEQSGRAVTLVAGRTSVRITAVPGDLVEVRTTPEGADPEQEGGPVRTALFVLEGSEELYEQMRNPFVSSEDVLGAVLDVVTPTLETLAATKKDL